MEMRTGITVEGNQQGSGRKLLGKEINVTPTKVTTW
jgi:hypothetical protein